MYKHIVSHERFVVSDHLQGVLELPAVATVILEANASEGSYIKSWNDYRTSHAVSQHAARTTRNCLSTQMAESGEVDEDGGDKPGQ